jgi:hypothetical protein
MRRILACGLMATLIAAMTVLSGSAAAPGGKNPNLGKVRHVVLLKFKNGTTQAQIAGVEDGFRALSSKVPGVVDFEWGTNMSPENLAQGFTHCFLVTFHDAAARDAYLPHPAHQAFVKILRPHLDKVFVIDYVAKN